MEKNKPYPFGPSQRIKKAQEFDALFRQRISVADSHLIVYARHNELSHCRIGLGVGKKLGNAIARNRYKRHLREAFRLSQHDLPFNGDLVVIPRKKESISTERYQASLIDLCQQLQRKLKRAKP